MKNPRRIDFTLIFDGIDGLWPSISVFESDIANFFRDKGIEANMVKSIDGQSGEYTLILSKIEQVVNMPNVDRTNQGTFKSLKPTPPGKQVDNIRKQIGGNNGVPTKSSK